MGKKVKKEADSPPKDVFDPLSIETKNAATAVLMLKSPEHDILAKACEAIHRFADKGDENKVALTELGALDSLTKLISHEDKLVRRNAVMALAVMSAHGEVKRLLKKMDIIASVIDRLAPEEEVVIHEFASLCLSFLSSEPTVKVQIFNDDGLEPLIALLSSPDPDVKKNSLETIYNLVQDFYSRAVISELKGIPPMLELLKTEFPVIQQLALKTLATITSDVENRVALRECQGLDRLIEILGSQELSDLHVDTLLVVSNCLEDEEVMALIQQTGALDKLLHFARTSSQMEIQRNAVRAILRAAHNNENKKMLHEHNVEQVLITLLGVDHNEVREVTCLAITVMCDNVASKAAFGQCDAIRPLVKLLQSDSGAVKEAAGLALSSLTTSKSNACAVFEEGVEPLIRLLADDRDAIIAHSAAILTNMSSQNALRGSIRAQGIMSALVEPLQSPNTLVQSKAALAVAAFACDSEARLEFHAAGGVEPLVKLLSSNHHEVRRHACWAVFVCASDRECSADLCRLGALEILQEINLSPCRKSQFSESALQKLFEGNLSIKYSMTGSLTLNDIIVDGFYDPGKEKSGNRVPSLEELSKMKVTSQQTVIMINGKLPEVEPPELAPAEEKLTDPRGRSPAVPSRNTADKNSSKNKGKGKKEDKAKEEVKITDDNGVETKPWLPPSDPAFCGLVSHVMELMLPLNNTRERVVLLARLVADAMGGPVERDVLHEFFWELHFSELKAELRSNVIPIGRIKKGVFCHRALLFKALADRLGINCTLNKGEFSRAWNVVMLIEETPKMSLVAYIVDLMHSPGRLMKAGSPEAIRYQTL
ncbi:armadillo repeat-containing protein 3 [Erpetoichthys calabaricus]|uniref:armadillo repeat-containing protein 3 n=1 Tax=Erpetoichthys calabaricus TaxID=27687 RepID=UPI0010A0914C|nr:armadillo repeat-containing protein 3 [Erpetoichthys calabaricus]